MSADNPKSLASLDDLLQQTVATTMTRTSAVASWFSERPDLEADVRKHIKNGTPRRKILALLTAHFAFPFKDSAFRSYADVLELTEGA